MPSNMQGPAVILFDIIGATGNRTILDQAYSASTTEKTKYWIHESITADYLEARYYLYAASKVYRYKSQPGYVFGYHYETGYESSVWVARRLPYEVVSDSRLAIFFLNRQLLYSARAGEPAIVRYWPRVVSNERDYFRVIGDHWYYDPASKTFAGLGQSVAGDCNLNQLGFEGFTAR